MGGAKKGAKLVSFDSAGRESNGTIPPQKSPLLKL